MNMPHDTWFPRPTIMRPVVQQAAAPIQTPPPAAPVTPIRPEFKLPAIPDLRLRSRDLSITR